MRVIAKITGLLLLVLYISLAGRVGAQTSTTKQKTQQTMTFTGKLERVVAIGGETTGWAIQLESETTIEGKPVKSVEIDYHGTKKLESLKDKRVKASGKLSHRHGVETGDRTILEVSSIREVKAK